MKFVLATANPGKIREMREILGATGFNILTRDECGIDFEVEETGSTFFENALIKAKAICEATGMSAIADDSGLLVDALNGEPGVYSSSYGGENLSSDERCAYLLKKLQGKEQARAKFVCTVICYFPDGEYIAAEGECLGHIVSQPSGSGGFGYDPIFLVEGKNKTMAELTSDEKNEISHRNEALSKLTLLLKERGYM
ncbi:MAG: RdgB/HAM1 family non-canonical purine NTP pyrophosphatase [Oscillospiraceae bacterium]|nr:RdgB/HAM1 family non-canonical purine NTP pyrophosphatase [Oscillospiraceae bacterium]